MRKTIIALVGASTLVLTGCTTIPSVSDPQAIRSFDALTPAEEDLGPEDGQDPDLIVRDFFTASAIPASQYQLARSYLTPERAQSWQPSPTITIVDRLDVNSTQDSEDGPTRQPINDEDSLSFDVRGKIVGTLSADGGYVPANSDYTRSVILDSVDGQWRVANPPDDIVIERTALRNDYSPHNLYFFDPSGTTLVSDRRWLYTGGSSLDTALITMIVGGPSAQLAPGVMNELGTDATFTGVVDGQYQFTGMADLDDDAQRRLAAQMVWTLALADIPGPYSFTFDGNPVAMGEGGSTELTVDDFAEFNPQANAERVTTLYALRSGRLYGLGETDPRPVSGAFGQANNIESAEISSGNDTVSAVVVEGEGDRKRSTLEIAQVDGSATEVLAAQTLTRPTYEINSSSVWTVLNGTTVARVSRSATTNELSQTEVDTSALGENFGAISVLRLSYTGVRAAFIVDGRVYVATVSRPNAGERKLTNIQELLPAQDLAAVSLDWQTDGALIVGTATPETPVWRIEQDGSSGQPLSSANVSAPVVSVAATPTTTYITDSRATLELSSGVNSASFWREVRGLEGERAIPIVPR